MLIGRAGNSSNADDGCKPKLLKSSELRARLLQGLPEGEEDNLIGQCEEAGTYDTHRSAFWRVFKRIANLLDIQGADWGDHLAWSNLFKVSPSPGMNPSEALQDAQLEFAVKLLQIELETYQPRKIVFVTGIDWSSTFTSALRMNLISYVGQYVKQTGKYGASEVIVAVHPMTRPEDAYVAEFQDALKGTCLHTP